MITLLKRVRSNLYKGLWLIIFKTDLSRFVLTCRLETIFLQKGRELTLILDFRELARRTSSNESLQKFLGLLVIEEHVTIVSLVFRAFEDEHTLMHVVEDTGV